MSKIKDLSKITTRYSKEEGIAHPTIQKVDFRKPTVVHISKKEMEILHWISFIDKIMKLQIS